MPPLAAALHRFGKRYYCIATWRAIQCLGSDNIKVALNFLGVGFDQGVASGNSDMVSQIESIYKRNSDKKIIQDYILSHTGQEWAAESF